MLSDGPYGLEDLWVAIPKVFMPHAVPSNPYLRPRWCRLTLQTSFPSWWSYTTQEMNWDGGVVGHGPPEWQWRALRDDSSVWRPPIPRPAEQAHRLGVIEAVQWQLDTSIPHRYANRHIAD